MGSEVGGEQTWGNPHKDNEREISFNIKKT